MNFLTFRNFGGERTEIGKNLKSLNLGLDRSKPRNEEQKIVSDNGLSLIKNRSFFLKYFLLMSICWMRTWERMDVKKKRDILRALNLVKIMFDGQGYHCKFLR